MLATSIWAFGYYQNGKKTSARSHFKRSRDLIIESKSRGISIDKGLQETLDKIEEFLGEPPEPE